MTQIKKINSIIGADSTALINGDLNGDGYTDLVVNTVARFSSKPTAQGCIIWGTKDGLPPNFQLPVINNDPTKPQVHVTGITKLVQAYAPTPIMSNTINAFGSNIIVKDLNGDGIDDLITGVSYVQSNGSYSVTVDKIGHVIFGGENLPQTDIYLPDLNTPKGVKGFTISVPKFTVASNLVFLPTPAGDVNGDGFRDFFIQGSNEAGSPEAYLIFGRDGRKSPLKDILLDEKTGGWLKIAGANAASGSGDFNGDGTDDMILSVTPQNRTAIDENTTSISYILLGNQALSANFDVNSMPKSKKAIKVIAPRNILSLFNAGDVNGDGVQDVVVRTFPIRDVTDSHIIDIKPAPTLYVLFGNKNYVGSEVIDLTNLKPSQGAFITGLNNETNAFNALYNSLQPSIAVCDYNKDGYDDIIVSSPACTHKTTEKMAIILGKKNFVDVDLDNLKTQDSNVLVFGTQADCSIVRGACAANDAYLVSASYDNIHEANGVYIETVADIYILENTSSSAHTDL